MSNARPAARRAVIAGLLLACVVSAYVAVAYSFPDPSLAAWWPAAGFAAVAGMLSRGRERWLVILLVIIATGIGNLLAGRDPVFAFLLGMGNSIEVVVIAALLAPRGVPLRVATLAHVTRLLWVTLAGAASSGLVLGVVAAIFLQRPLAEAVLQLSASHAAATLVMLPIVMVPWSEGRTVRRLELAAQSTVLLALIAVVFWPGNAWPVAAMPFVALLWAAFRFPLIISSAQLLLTAAAVIVLSSLGGGPFAAFDGGSRASVVLIQVFLLVYCSTALLTAAARADWFAVVNRLRAQEEVLRAGIVNALAGIVIAERADGELRVVAINDRARRDLGADAPPFGIDALDEALGHPLEPGQSVQLVIDREGRTIEVAVADQRNGGGADLVTIVTTDVSEREERERIAHESAAELRRLNAQQDDFISAVSHELRTPVTSILGFSEQLDEARLPEDIAQAGVVIARNARRLADVIEDVLELSKLSALGGPMSPPAPVDLMSLALECAADADGLALARRVRVEVAEPHESLIVTSRTRDLLRVCANLLSNAVKFSHDDGVVTIEIARDGDGAVIRVVDHGLGIPTEYRDMVWERFVRAPLDSHRSVPGTGLGLPIVKALVEARLGGTVRLAETPGGGTTVEVRLPAVAPAVLSAPSGAR
ncbi:MAG: MASE1 domain-containing protein [Microcella sp.]|uniref:sensor histidine kinase n=1 Tax=Microcella sp. TaxID=1913979 RepID=UPI0024CD655F|nr:ATP-binding protein [Microcella sp.]UYN83002.1 MAG: MASE1 domain-containing protein [Microcella sp.]